MFVSVIVFAGFFLPFRGGYANSIFQISKRLVSRGHKVTVITTNTEEAIDEEIIDGVEIVRLSCWKLFGGTFPVPKITIKNFQKIHKVRIDHSTIVSTQTRFFITSFLGFTFALVNRLPLIHTERGSRHSIVPNKLVYIIGVLIDHIFGWLIIKKAKLSIGVSDQARLFLRHLGAKNPIMIPNGVNEVYLLEGERRLKEKPVIKEEKKLLYVGRLIYAKGIQDLLLVFKQLFLKDNRIRLFIVGEGNYRNCLERLTRELGLIGVVDFMGELDSAEIINKMIEIDIFINPSYSEGLPTSVLEAGAAGLPVVATDIGGTRDIIPSDEFGFLYPVGHLEKMQYYLLELLNNPTLRRKQGEKLQAFIKTHFSWNDICIQYEKILLKCVTK